MSLPDVVSREQWLEARRELLAREKEHTRARDALNADRRGLPMVMVSSRYVFEGPDGPVTLAELFRGQRQLIVQHVMFGPDWEQPCPGCSAAINGAPGAVLLYALLAVLLWPPAPAPAAPAPAAPAPAPDATAPFPAARAVGRRAARAAWLAVWLSLACLALLPATRAPRALSTMVAGTTPGEPAWLAWIDTHAAAALTRHGSLASLLLAGVLAAVALLPSIPPTRRTAVVLALAVAAALWLAGGLGGILTGSATDPGTGPLLALLALAFWPAAPTAPAASPIAPVAPAAGPAAPGIA
jgi:hypothetical protein